MKRLIAFTLMIMTALCIVSCSPVMKNGNSLSRKNSLDNSFEATANITLERLDTVGIVKRFGNGMWSVEFESPNTLSGIKLEFSEGDVNASYKGLSFSVPQSVLPVKAMMLNLMKAVDDNAKTEELSGEETDGGFAVKGKLEGGDYVLTLNENGEISEFEMPNNKLKMIFSDYKLIESTNPTQTTAVTTSAEETTTAVTECAVESAE